MESDENNESYFLNKEHLGIRYAISMKGMNLKSYGQTISVILYEIQ